MAETKEKVLTVEEVQKSVSQPQVVDALRRYGTDLEVFVQEGEAEPRPLNELTTQKYNPEGGAHQRVVLRMKLGTAEKKVREEKVREEPEETRHTHLHAHARH